MIISSLPEIKAGKIKDSAMLKVLDRRLSKHRVRMGANGRAEIFNYALPLLVVIYNPMTGKHWQGTAAQALLQFI